MHCTRGTSAGSRRALLRRLAAIAAVLIVTLVAGAALSAATGAVQEQLPQPAETIPAGQTAWDVAFLELREGLVRLPLAALLGTALALRPKRRGTPKRTTPVVQTQIILAVVGAVIMLVVGASLARAFGIVGAANLIRYRSKIDDPKDAVVMLAALAVGLAAGVGLYAFSIFSTAFLVVALLIIESFEPRAKKQFTLKIQVGKDTDELRGRIETILARHNLRFELRAASDEELSYSVRAPLDVDTETVTDHIRELDPSGHAAVDWDEKKDKK